MKLRTRILSLFLTVLMVVGVLPMSVFAIESVSAGDGAISTEGEAWDSPDDIKEFLDKHFGIEKTSSASPKLNTGSTASGGSAPTYVSPTENATNFGYDLTSGGKKYVEYRFASSVAEQKSKLSQYAGRDFYVSFDMAIEATTPMSGHVYPVQMEMYVEGQSNNNFLVNLIGFNKSDLSVVTSDGTAGAWLSSRLMYPTSGQYVRYHFWFDMGGERSETSGRVYCLVTDLNNNYLKFTQWQMFSEANFDLIYGETAKEGYDQAGYILSNFKFINTTSTAGVKVDNFNIKYSTNTKSENNDITLSGFYSFDNAEIGLSFNGSGKVTPVFSTGGSLNGAEKNGVNAFVVVDDGNGGGALALDPPGAVTDRYVNVSSGGISSGEKISLSFDVKKGASMAGSNFTQIIDRTSKDMYKDYDTKAWYTALDDATKAKVGSIIGTTQKDMISSAIIKNNYAGEIYYLYYPDANSTETVASPIIGNVNTETFTNIEIVYDGKTNLAWIYMNGVLKSPEAGFLALDPSWHYVLSLSNGGIAPKEFRFYQTSHTGHAVTFDNICFYEIRGNTNRTNLNPLEGIAQDEDGFLRYYEDGVVVPNYTSPDGVWFTEAGGVVTKKEKHSFIDWNEAATRESAEIATYSTMATNGAQAYVTALFGSDLAKSLKLHYKNARQQGPGNLCFMFDQSSTALREVTYDACDVEGKNWSKVTTKTAKLLNLDDFDELWLDVYTEEIYEYLMYLRFECPLDLAGREPNYTPNYQTRLNLGTTSYYPPTTNAKGDKADYSPFIGEEVDGWKNIVVNLSAFSGNRPTSNSRQHIEKFYFQNSGWTELDKSTNPNGDWNYNEVEAPVVISDFYLVKYVRLKDMADAEALYEYLGNGDYVPVDFTGKYVAASGNEYFYAIYDHKRVVDKAFYDTQESGATVTGYSIDEYGVLSPLNGMYTFGNKVAYKSGSTKRTYSKVENRIYVEGVLQKGTEANGYVVVYDGVAYNVNGDGVVTTAYKSVLPSSVSHSSVATYVKDNTTFLAGSDYNSAKGGSAYLHFNSTSSSTLPVLTYASNSATTNIVSTVNRGPAKTADQRDIAMQFKYYGNTANPYFYWDPGDISYPSTVLEFDIKIEDDWNMQLQTYTRVGGASGGQVFSLFINPDLTITATGHDRPAGTLEYNTWAKMAMVVRIVPNGDAYKYMYDIYLNGQKIISDLEQTGQSSKGTGSFEFFRCFAAMTSDQYNKGTYLVDNLYIYKADAPTGVVANDGFVGGKYYEQGALAVSKLLNLDGVTYYAKSNGYLAYEEIVSVDGVNYHFNGYAGEIITSGVYDGKLFENGKLVTTKGVHKVAGNYYRVESNDGTVSAGKTVELTDQYIKLECAADGRIVGVYTLVESNVLTDADFAKVTLGADYNVASYGANTQVVHNENVFSNGLTYGQGNFTSYIDLSTYDYMLVDLYTPAQTKTTSKIFFGTIIGEDVRFYPVEGVTGTLDVSAKKFTDDYSTANMTYDKNVYVAEIGSHFLVKNKNGSDITNVTITTAEGNKYTGGRLYYCTTDGKYYVRLWQYVTKKNTLENSANALANAQWTTIEYSLKESALNNYKTHIGRIQYATGGWSFGKTDWSGAIKFANFRILGYSAYHTDVTILDRIVDGDLKGGWNGTVGAVGSTYADAVTHTLKTGIQVIDGVWYEFDNNGVCKGRLNGIYDVEQYVTGNTLSTAKKYFINGVLQFGLSADGKYISNATTGVLLTGQQTVNGKTYDCDPTTFLATERSGNIYVDATDGKAKYYVNGVAKTGLFVIGEVTYIADNSGALLTGQQTVNGKTYDVNATTYVATVRNGIIADVTANNAMKYYVDGVAKTGLFKMGEIWYYADANGVLTVNATKVTLNIPYYDVDTALANRVADVVDYNVVIYDDFYAADEEFYANGVLQSAEGLYEANDGKHYYVASNGKVLEDGEIVVGDLTYDVVDYIAYPRHDGINQGKFFWNGNVVTGVIDKARFPESTFIGDNEIVYADENGNAFENGIIEVNGVWYTFTNYKGIIADGILEGKYYVQGTLKTGVFTVGENTYVADADGVLLVGQQTAGGKTYDCDATTYVATIRNGIFADQTANNADKYYVDGVAQNGLFSMAGTLYIADENGVLLTGQQTANGQTYDCDATTYVATVRNGIFADQTANNADKFYADGIVQIGCFVDGTSIYITDENGVLLTGQQTYNGITYDCDATTYIATVRNGIIADVTADNAMKYYSAGIAQVGFFEINNNVYLTDADGKLLSGRQTVEAEEGRVYDFDATTFVGTMRDNYQVYDELYWIDGYKADGICFVQGVEMYFVEGALGSGEIPYFDGTIHTFLNGYRVTDGGQVENKAPQHITVTLLEKTANGENKVGFREFYQLWNTDFSYKVPYNGCYVASVTLICGGVETVVDGNEIVIENIDADYEIVIVYNLTAEKSHTYVKASEDKATCTAGGTVYFVCAYCGDDNYTESTEIDANGHNYITVTTPATCNAYGTKVTTCEHCGDSSTVYLPKTAHSWTLDTENSTAATCGVNGANVYTCECGSVKNVTVYATGAHEWEICEVIDATCSTPGSIEYECNGCGQTKKTVTPTNNNHVYDVNDKDYDSYVDVYTGVETRIYNCCECGKIRVVAVAIPATVVPDDDDK